MTEQEYKKACEKLTRLMADIQLRAMCNTSEAFSELERTNILNNLRVDLLALKIAYLESRIDTLEKLVNKQTAERTDEDE